jgi:hypothetical protein
MIKEFVERFDKARPQLLARFKAAHPATYGEIVKAVVEVVRDPDGYAQPNHEKIHEIDDGHYQGTLLFVIPADEYQPSTYWYVMVGYGSCSGCDTLQAISGYSDEPPTDEQAKDYMTLALHVVQKLRMMENPYDFACEQV